MKKVSNERLQEEYYTKTLTNGLHIYLMPKPQFNRTYGLFATRFGSNDQEFIPLGRTNWVKVPAGVAHFLEHKTFECENGEDATDIFAQLGGEANAYTTYDKTVYLFTATSMIKENVTALLDFVQSPAYNDESVKREQGIIEQELRMYLDRPNMAIYLALLQNMYKKNYVREDIGGTVDSIQQINEEILNLCYQSFYHPSNMTFVLVGKFDLNEIITLIEENQNAKTFPLPTKIKRKYYLESNEVLKQNTISYMDVLVPKVGCGIKFSIVGLDKETIYKNMVILDMLMNIYFDESSDNYHKLLSQNIIDNSFEYDCYFEPTFAHVIFTTDTNQVEEFKLFMKEAILKIPHLKIEENVFERYKKVEVANTISRFNSLEYIANLLVDFDFLDLELFDTIEIKDNLTLQDVEAFQSKFINEAITFHTIYPKKKAEDQG